MLLTYTLFRTQPVQKWVTQRLTAFLSDKLHTNIQIKGVDINLFKTLVLEDVYIEDLHHDTLLYIKKFRVDVKDLNFNQNKFTLNKISISNCSFALKNYKNEKDLNLQFILDYFSGEPASDSSHFQFLLSELVIENSSFLFHNENEKPSPGGMDFFNLNVKDLNAHLEDIRIIDDSIRTKIKNISLRESCGFVLNHFEAETKITPKEIEVGRFIINTPQSHISRYYSMRYNQWSDFLDYNNKVRMYATLTDCDVAVQDIAYFAPALSPAHLKGKISGQIQGTVADLSSQKLNVFFGKKSLLATRFHIKGLPDIDHTHIQMDIDHLLSNPADIDNTYHNTVPKNALVPISNITKNIGEIAFTGNFEGLYNDFKSKGRLKTGIGNLNLDIAMKIPSKQIPTYSGNINGEGFDFGKLIENSTIIGPATFNATISGQGFNIDQLKDHLEITFEQVKIKDYLYKNIAVNGDLDSKLFNGNIKINDKNIFLDFIGKIDLNDIKKPIFDFNASLKNVQMKSLNMLSDSLELSTSTHLNFSGTNIDNLEGEINFKNTSIIYKNRKLLLDSLKINADKLNQNKQLTLRSDLADADIKGNFDLKTIISSFKSLLQKFVPSFDLGEIITPTPQDITFHIKLKNTSKFTSVFYPDLSISENASFLGKFDNKKNYFALSGGADELHFKKTIVKGLIIDGETEQDVFAMDLASSSILFNDSIPIKNVNISNNIKNDSLHFNIKLADNSSLNRLDLNGEIAIASTITQMTILPSELFINNDPWEIKNAFSVLYSENRFIINNFTLKNEEQQVNINGFISDDPEDQLRIAFSNLNLENFNQLTKNYNIKISGNANGSAQLYTLLSKPKLNSKASIQNLTYNRDTIGDLAFSSEYDNNNQTITFEGNASNKTFNAIKTDGKIDLSKKSDNLNANVEINDIELHVIEPFFKEYISGIEGTAHSKLFIDGSIDNPQLHGKVYFENTSLTVNYLQSKIFLTDYITLEKDKILIEDLELKDISGKKAIANGSINFNHFKNTELNIRIETDQFLCLNTTERDNNLYYGKAKASGRFLFIGPVENLNINIEATTEKGTQFFIPINYTENAGNQSFINFINRSDTLKKNLHPSLSGLNITLDLNVTEDAEVKLITDQISGDNISSRGTGNIRVSVSRYGDFQMFGQYTIEKGKYLFSFQNVAKKEFSVEKGGTISWNGDPANAQINLTALYQLRSQVKPLYQAAHVETSDSSKRTLVQCALGLQKSLLNPEITFDLNFPDDQSIKNNLGSYLSNQDNITQQFFSLLILGKFYAPNNNSTASGFSSSVNELISSQLSSLSKSIYKGLDLNMLNGLGGSLTFFDEKLIISGTLLNANTTIINSTQQNNTQNNNSRASDLTGDVNIEYKIDKSGNFRATAFNRIANNYNNLPISNPNSPNIQGIGISYKKDFDTFGELFRNFLRRQK